MAKPILRIGLHRNECIGSRKNIGIIPKGVIQDTPLRILI